MQATYLSLVHDNPTNRLKLSELPYAAYFTKNQFIETQLFIEQIQLKEQSAVESFFVYVLNVVKHIYMLTCAHNSSQLQSTMDSLPKNNCKNKILPCLLNAVKFGPNAAHAVVPIFAIGAMMPEQEYKGKFVPLALDMFESNDETVRIHLLKNFSTLLPLLGVDQVEKRVYPNVSKGFASPNPAVREVTVKSMIDIVPKVCIYCVRNDFVL